MQERENEDSGELQSERTDTQFQDKVCLLHLNAPTCSNWNRNISRGKFNYERRVFFLASCKLNGILFPVFSRM